MKILRFEVIGLLGRPGNIKGDLNDDINIITGKNGAGKTTLMKLMWYILSGNINLAIKEIPFVKAHIVTDLYECTVHKISSNTCKVDLIEGGRRHIFEDQSDEDGDVVENAEDLANPKLIEYGSSVFFPTFRRIEGGFTLGGA